MLRRVFVNGKLRIGRLRLEADQAHHLCDVLRVGEGETIELFNAAGETAEARVELISDGVDVTVQRVSIAPPLRSITIAAAVPKGERADWMIEKLSEIGVTRFIPLATQRSVVLPSGEAKFQRWRRIATESAKQSRRIGVMDIEPLTELKDLLGRQPSCIYLSTVPDAKPLSEIWRLEVGSRGLERKEDLRLSATNPQPPTPDPHDGTPSLLIGPEGGWSDGELADFAARGLTGAKLTPTILRTETAAIAAALIAVVS